MTHARVIVAGGGGAAASRPLDERFAEWIGSHGRMLYWPMALPDDHPLRATCFDWICSVFQRLGVANIAMWTDFLGHSESELEHFEAIYIGGGNTYRLLHLLGESGFDQALLRGIRSGKAVYGGSAGAAILGRDIQTVAHMDQNLVGLNDQHGLDAMGGYAIWCHYEPADNTRIAAYIEANVVPVLAISERAGLVLEDGRLIASGYEPTICFTPAGRRVLGAGQDVGLPTST